MSDTENNGNGEDVRSGYDMGYEAGKAHALGDNATIFSELGNLEILLDAGPKFRRASLGQ